MSGIEPVSSVPSTGTSTSGQSNSGSSENFGGNSEGSGTSFAKILAEKMDTNS